MVMYITPNVLLFLKLIRTESRGDMSAEEGDGDEDGDEHYDDDFKMTTTITTIRVVFVNGIFPSLINYALPFKQRNLPQGKAQPSELQAE
jgi:hypothetical protein